MASVKADIIVDVVDNGATASAKRTEAALKSLAESEIRGANAAKVLAQANLEQAEAQMRTASSADALRLAELAAAGATRQLAAAEGQASKASASLASNAKNAAAATATIQPAAAGATKAVGRISQAQKLQGLAMAQNINLVSELAMGFGNMSPVTRGLGLAFATAGNNAFALASALGPMGVVIGTLVGVLPGLIGMFHALSDSADDSAESMDGARRSYTAMLDAQRAGRQQMEGSRRLLEGDASTEELDDAIAVARQVQTGARRRESDIIRARGGAGDTENITFHQRLFNAYRQTEEFQSGGELSLESVRRFADEFQQRPENRGGPTRLVTDDGIALAGLRELRTASTRSFDEGSEERDASSGSIAAAERLERLQERRRIAAEREQREAMETDAEQASSRVGVAQAEFDRQLNLAGIAPARAQRLRSDLSAARGDDDAIFRSGDLNALGDNRGAIVAAAERVREQREIAQRRQAEIRAAQLAEIDNERGARADATTRDLPGIGERAGGAGGRGIETRIAEAIRNDAEAAERQREPGRLEVTIRNQAGATIGSASIAEGEISQVELDAEAAGPEGLGSL